MFKAGIVDSGIGGTDARSRNAGERGKGNALRHVKPDTVVFLKTQEKLG